MNIQKYKKADCQRVLAEADVLRPNHERQLNVNDKLTKYNYSFSNGDKEKAMQKLESAIAEHNSKSTKELRKDAVLIQAICITFPEHYQVSKEEEKNFFEICKKATLYHFGLTENDVLLDSVHMDETRPHMHLYLMPRKNGLFQAKNISTKMKLQSYHSVVDKALRNYCRWYNGGILLSDEERIGKNYNIPIKQLKQNPIERTFKELEFNRLIKKAEKSKEIIKQSEIEFIRLQKVKEQIEEKEKTLKELTPKCEEIKKEWEKLKPYEKVIIPKQQKKIMFYENWLMPTLVNEIGEQKTNEIINKAENVYIERMKKEKIEIKEVFYQAVREIKTHLYNIFHPQPKKEPIQTKTKESDKGFSL